MIADVMKRLEDTLGRSSIRKELGKLKKEAGGYKTQIKKLTDIFLDGDIDEESYKKRNAHLKTRLEEVEAEIL